MLTRSIDEVLRASDTIRDRVQRLRADLSTRPDRAEALARLEKAAADLARSFAPQIRED